jgi:hypothetical protein
MAFPAIAAAHDGYKVFAVVDASGTYSKMAQEITLARVVQAGVVPMDTAAVASELQKDLASRRRRSNGPRSTPRSSRPMQLLIESYAEGAGGRQKDQEQLDSQRG